MLFRSTKAIHKEMADKHIATVLSDGARVLSNEKYFVSLLDKQHYLDAAFTFAICFGAPYYTYWRYFHNAEPVAQRELIERMTLDMKSRLRRVMIAGREAFNREEVKLGELPVSNWETPVYLDGKPVQRL